MANLQQFSVTSEGAAQVTVPSYEIAARVEDGDGTVLADFTGGNALHFPAVLASLTSEQRAELNDQIAATIVLMRAGVL